MAGSQCGVRRGQAAAVTSANVRCLACCACASVCLQLDVRRRTGPRSLPQYDAFHFTLASPLPALVPTRLSRPWPSREGHHLLQALRESALAILSQCLNTGSDSDCDLWVRLTILSPERAESHTLLRQGKQVSQAVAHLRLKVEVRSCLHPQREAEQPGFART